MNYRNLKVLIVCAIACHSCVDTGQDSTTIWKNEILEAEHNFAKMAKDEGIHKAFLAFAAENAVLLRQDSLILGREALDNYFQDRFSKNAEINLSWTPDFVDVSSSGDMGYTYGKYTITFPDPNGHKINKEGIFHTVWKRQADGAWKFVWD